jgi:hypothetical protein
VWISFLVKVFLTHPFMISTDPALTQDKVEQFEPSNRLQDLLVM